MSQSIALKSRWPTSPSEGARRLADERAARGHGRKQLRRGMSLLGDAAWLLLGVWMLPFAILLVGAPIALSVRLLLEIVERM